MKNILYILIIIVVCSCKNEHQNNSPSNTIKEENLDLETQEETFSSWTCAICGNPMQNRGYEETKNGDWVLIDDENLQGQICSPTCGRKHVENFKKITDKYGIDLEE